ncbi:MAG: tyrosine-protein phosphatase [Tannerellaceae bacterium]|nr:tyrosine-protein phosphatase [Tannerellaceae bacterium]
MLVKLISLFVCASAFVGCTSNSPEIRTLCLRDDIGNYVIKWESDSPLQGNVKLFVSDNPEKFDISTPVGNVNINDGVTTYITNDNMTRKYFMLSFNDKTFQTIGSRGVAMDSVQNLRDIGGYVNNRDFTTRWGKIYRSGKLNTLSEWDSMRLDNLGIKTIIDLRGANEVHKEPIRYKNLKVINLPIPITDEDSVSKLIEEGRMRKGDAILFLQDMYLQFIKGNSPMFASAMNELLDKENYPVLITCSLGKDRAGFLSALILASLGVPEDTILKDYTTSNDCIEINKIAKLANGLNADAQETFTVIINADETYLDIAIKKILKDYGSMDKYLDKEIGMNEKKRAKLKEIMLY